MRRANTIRSAWCGEEEGEEKRASSHGVLGMHDDNASGEKAPGDILQCFWFLCDPCPSMYCMNQVLRESLLENATNQDDSRAWCTYSVNELESNILMSDLRHLIGPKRKPW